jgi:hypothetical protein
LRHTQERVGSETSRDPRGRGHHAAHDGVECTREMTDVGRWGDARRSTVGT